MQPRDVLGVRDAVSILGLRLYLEDNSYIYNYVQVLKYGTLTFQKVHVHVFLCINYSVCVC